VLQLEILEIEGLARSDADKSKLGADFLLVFLGGRELPRKVEYSKKFVFTSSLSIFGKSMVGAGGGTGCFR
jgi:hypothetical protein